MTLNKISIVFDRYQKAYCQGVSKYEFLQRNCIFIAQYNNLIDSPKNKDIVKGCVIVENKCEIKHEGIELYMDGVVNLQYNLKNISLMETFYSSSKSLELSKLNTTLVKLPGKLAPGVHEFCFALPLNSTRDDQQVLYETYYGVYISIQVSYFAALSKSLLSFKSKLTHFLLQLSHLFTVQT